MKVGLQTRVFTISSSFFSLRPQKLFFFCFLLCPPSDPFDYGRYDCLEYCLGAFTKEEKGEIIKKGLATIQEFFAIFLTGVKLQGLRGVLLWRYVGLRTYDERRVVVNCKQKYKIFNDFPDFRFYF